MTGPSHLQSLLWPLLFTAGVNLMWKAVAAFEALILNYLIRLQVQAKCCFTCDVEPVSVVLSEADITAIHYHNFNMLSLDTYCHHQVSNHAFPERPACD